METNNLAREATVAALNKVPKAGMVLSALTSAFWPQTVEDIWDQLRARIEALIRQRIAERVYQEVKESLDGLKTVLEDYTKHVGDPKQVNIKYDVALGHFERDRPHFQSKGYELLLLPLFTRFATMHLALLNDGFRHGASWGWSTDSVEQERATLCQLAREYSSYAYTWVVQGYKQLQLPGDSTHRHENWRARNAYLRQMNLDVLDHSQMWVFYDPDLLIQVNGVVPPLQRTIFSDPIGTADDTGININHDLIGEESFLPITGLNVWAWNYVDGIQVAYGGQWVSRMGNQDGGSAERPHGWSGSIDPNKPIVRVTGNGGDVIDGIEFWYGEERTVEVKDQNGQTKTEKITEFSTATGYCGRPNGGAYDFHYDGHVLSSIHIMGMSEFYKSANCVIFGFRPKEGYKTGRGVSVTEPRPFNPSAPI